MSKWNRLHVIRWYTLPKKLYAVFSLVTESSLFLSDVTSKGFFACLSLRRKWTARMKVYRAMFPLPLNDFTTPWHHVMPETSFAPSRIWQSSPILSAHGILRTNCLHVICQKWTPKKLPAFFLKSTLRSRPTSSSRLQDFFVFLYLFVSVHCPCHPHEYLLW